MTEISNSLNPVDALSVDVLTDNVSDNYVSKTLFAVSEFANVVRAGAKANPRPASAADVEQLLHNIY